MDRDTASIGVPNAATPDVRVCDVSTHVPVEWIISYKNRYLSLEIHKENIKSLENPKTLIIMY